MFDSNEPLYLQIEKMIDEKISSGEWIKGFRIPSERELSEQYMVSRITIRKSLDSLERKGKIERIRGKGTFVVGNYINQTLNNLYSFTEQMHKQGKVAYSKLVNKRVIKADEKFARKLNINVGDYIAVIERLRCAKLDKPIMYETTYFSLDKYSYVLNIDVEKESLYEALKEEYQIVITRAVEKFKACELTSKECELLECPKKQFGLLVKRTSYMNNELVCYSTIVSLGDLYEFTVVLE